jgi:hypothetical protein
MEKLKFVVLYLNLDRRDRTIIIMKKILKIFFIINLILSGSDLIPSFGQEKEGMVKYTPHFRFTDGIYLNFDQVKLNSPIPKAKLLTSIEYNDRGFFKKLLEGDKIYFYDNMGVRREVLRNSIWGYARNGVLYIQVQENFNRIKFVGSICHFVADITTYDSRYNSPYGYYDHYYSPYYVHGVSPWVYSNYSLWQPPYRNYSPYSPYYGRNSMSHNELKQYIIDFESGKVLAFDIDNTELLLMKDNALYEEYVQLPGKKKKDLMLVYIRKFNEKNPLYLPSQ